jgi:hypothetical protein
MWYIPLLNPLRRACLDLHLRRLESPIVSAKGRWIRQPRYKLVVKI